jgi:tungstate transport system ATP-binding protein
MTTMTSALVILGNEATLVPPRLMFANVCLDIGGKRLIDDISLSLEAGPPTVVMGPNGAGKSLLLRLCHGLLHPTSGRIIWEGGASVGARHAQAMVFQRPVMLRRSVAANVDYALRVSGMRDGQTRRERVLWALTQAGLAPLAKRSARVLSGGEQQRLALARAWALMPQILFLDEPTANLDPAATRACEDMIRTIDSSGTKIVMTTHDLGQARRIAGEIVFLHRGRLTEQSPAAVFFNRPQSEPARAFLKGELFL